MYGRQILIIHLQAELAKQFIFFFSLQNVSFIEQKKTYM